MAYQIVIGARDDASSKLTKVRDRAEQVAKKAAQLGAAFTAAGGAVLAFATRQIGVIDGMAKSAKAAGVSAEALQELRFAAERSGASARQLDEGLRRMNRRIGLAADGAGPAAATLERMGISVRDVGGNVRGTEDILDEFIMKTGELGSQAEIAAAASALFGDDAGPKLALLLAEGSQGIAGLREEARRFGVVSNENASQAEKTADAITNLKASATAFGQSLTVAVAPILEKIARFLATAIPVAATGAQVAITRLRELMVRALSLMAEKAQGFVDSILQWVPASSDVARSLGETSDRLRDFSRDTGELADTVAADTNAALVDLDGILNDISERTAPPAAASLQGLTDDADDLGASATAAAGDLATLEDAAASAAGAGRNLAQTIGGPDGLRQYLEDMAATARERAEPAAMELIERFSGLGFGAFSAAEGVEEVTAQAESLAETQAPLEDWADALVAAFGDIEGSAGDAVRGIAGIIGTINQLQATAARQGGTLTLAQQLQGGAQIGGFATGLFGIEGPSGQTGGALGGALGYAAGAAVTTGMTGILGSLGGPIGAIIGAVIGGGLFEDEGETVPRAAVLNNQLMQGIRDGQNLQQYVTPWTRETALGVTTQITRQTEALGTAGTEILSAIVAFDETFAEILRNTTYGDRDAVRSALLGPSGENETIYEGEVSINRILADRFNTVLRGFDQQVQNLVGTVTDVEDGFKRLGAALALLEELDTGPLEQYEEALRQAGLTVVESLGEQGDALIESARNFSGSTAELERLAAGTQAFNQAVVAALANIDRVATSVSQITQGTLEDLEFRRLGEEGGAQAQIDFLLQRAGQLRDELSTLDDASAIERTIQLINQLVAQASGLIEPGQIGGFIDQVTPLLTEAEEIAQQRLQTIREAVIDVATATGDAIREAIAEPVSAMQTAGDQMASASSTLIDASARFAGGVTIFSQSVLAIPAQIDITVNSGFGEVNAAG